jgi:hypothetical protein
VSKALQQELDSAHAINRRLLDRLSELVSQGGAAPQADGAPPPAAAAPVEPSGD